MNRRVYFSIFLVMIIAGGITAQQPAKSGDGSRAITGRVFNHDGQPLADKKVFIEKAGSGPTNHREAFTNDAGEFRFDNLLPGVYSLLGPGAWDGEQQQKFYRPGDSVTFRVKKGGVITGTVTDSAGEPLIAVRVRTLRVRGEDGSRIHHSGLFSQGQRESLTDDRGVYRFWGLAPGSYLVSVGGESNDNRNFFLYAADEDTPTYHPSAATPETAAEVNVADGQEVIGIDIHHRGESGHSISGSISGMVASGSKQEGVIVTLIQAATGVLVGKKGFQTTDGSSSFTFEDLADGEYDLTALHLVAPNINADAPAIKAASPHRRVTIKGKDLTGVELKLTQLGSIDGRVVLEGSLKSRCRTLRNTRMEETVIIVNGEGAEPPLPNFTFLMSNIRGVPVVPDQKGDFTVPALKAAQYRVEAHLPSEDWYISSISLPDPTQARPIDVGRDGIVVKSGQRVTGLTVSIQEGAASVRGRVITAQANATLPARLRVHLVPAERQQSENALRFAEAAVKSDGSFLMTNIAPGRYRLLARPVDDLRGDSNRPLAWDREARAKLAQEAVTADTSIELQPCQRVSDYTLRYAPPATTNPKKML